MRSQSVRYSLIAWPLVLSLVGCSVASYSIRPPAPEQLPATQNPVFPVTDSNISFPIHADLSAFLDTVNDERIIPKKFDHWGNSIKSPKGIDYKYYAERDDFSMKPSASSVPTSSADGAALRDWWKGVELSESVPVTAALRYKIGVNPHPGSAGASVQCGDGGEWPRRATLNGGIAIDMTPSYGLSASVTGVAVNTIDSCKIGNADVDVAKEVHNKLADTVRGGLQNAIARINAMTIKSQVEDAWNALRNPIQLKPDAWLVLNIDKIGHSGFSGSGQIVDDTIQMIGKPVIVFGDEPPPAPAALPQLEARPASTGFRILATTQWEYAALSQTLANKLKGKRISNDSETIVIADASIYGNGGNQVVIRIDFKGDARGHVYFVGKPELNTLTQTVYFGNLRYDIASGQMLEKAADWLYRSRFREIISEEAIVGMTASTNHVRDLLVPALNRTLSPAVSMQGRVTSVQGVGVFADARALHIRAMAEGTLNLTVGGGF